MSALALCDALGVDAERGQELNDEVLELLKTADNMLAVCKALADKYDPESILVGGVFSLAVLAMYDKRVVPQGYSIEMNAVPNDPPERPAEDSPDPPERWVCPECGAIVEEIVYVTLPRTMVQGEHGEHTEVTCPVCNRQTIGMLWRVAEVVEAVA